MAKVSVIVPVYNVEDYLAMCLDTIINQTFKDIEIICVNDGSTDDSLNILEHYKNLDSRIKIISKENGGLSSARNAGMEIADGEYILFVDSDDWISSVAVESLYNNAINNNSDVVVFDFVWKNLFDNKFLILTINNYGNTYENKPFNKDMMGPLAYKEIPVSTWSKFYKKEFLLKNDISFFEDMIFEDIPYWASVFVNAERITYLPKPLYFYRKDRDGAITSQKGKEIFDVFKGYDRVEKVFKDSGYWDKYKLSINLLKILDFQKKYYEIKPEFKEEFFNVAKNEFMKIETRDFDDLTLLPFERKAVEMCKNFKNLDYKTFMSDSRGCR